MTVLHRQTASVCHITCPHNLADAVLSLSDVAIVPVMSQDDVLLIQECEVVDDVRMLKPIFKQRLAANSKAFVITDVGSLSARCFSLR